MKIVVSEFMDAAAIESLKQRFEVHFDPTLGEKRAELLTLLGDADALIVRNRTQVNADLLAKAPKLRVVGRLGVGLDNIDVDACRTRNVEVFPATGANAQAVAEHVICTAMMLLRGAYLSSAEVAAGKWPRAALGDGRETSGKTLGIVGFGSIGRLTAKLAHGLGMRVLATDAAIPNTSPVWRQSGVNYRDLEALLAESDAVTLHVPLTPETKRMFNADRIAKMRPGAVLINTSRGGIVDENALSHALREGKLGGAALDVFEHEPLEAGSPLARAKHLLLTPHIAGVTKESNVRVSTMIAEKVSEALGRRVSDGVSG